jgi:hypothetical protein
VSRDSAVIAGAPDEAGGRALVEILLAHGIAAELRDAGSGFVDVVVPRTLRDEARKLLKAHFDDLAREERLVVVADGPSEACFVMTGALQTAGIPAVARHGRFGETACVYVPHRVADDAREVLAALATEVREDETELDEIPPAAEREQQGMEGAEATVVPGGEAVGVSDGVGGVVEAASGVPAEEVQPASSGPIDVEPIEGLEPADELQPAREEPGEEGPPAYGSDLKPDYGDAFEPSAGGR